MSEGSRSYRSSGHRGRSRSRERVTDDYRSCQRPNSQERHRSYKPDGDERLSHRSRGREEDDNYSVTHSSSRRRPDSRDREDDRRAHSSRRSRSPPSSSRRRRSDSYSDSERRTSKTTERHKSSNSKHRQRPTSGSSDDSSSSDDEEISDRKTRKKKSSHRRDRSESVDSSKGRHKKESKEERRERKRRKKEKREKRKLKKNRSNLSKHKGIVNEYGKFGIISEADMFTKDQEFRAWLVEEKMLNPETVPVSKMKELFRVYMEDYNTATLPHEKFYALEKYESKMNAIRSGQTTTGDLGYDPRADEAALAAQHKRVAKTDGEVYIGRAQLEELRKLERDRVEASRMKRMGMEVKESMGVRYERD